MTLVEVAVGMLLLATLLVGILAAFRQHVHQVRHCRIRLEAAHTADALLTKWYSQGGTLPNEEEGEVPGNTNFAWRLIPLEETVDETLCIGTTRFELYYRDPETDGTTTKKDRDLFKKPLVSIDLVVPSSGRQARRVDSS